MNEEKTIWTVGNDTLNEGYIVLKSFLTKQHAIDYFNKCVQDYLHETLMKSEVYYKILYWDDSDFVVEFENNDLCGFNIQSNNLAD